MASRTSGKYIVSSTNV